jgi:protein involved in polysaccharide export with SLBB domain
MKRFLAFVLVFLLVAPSFVTTTSFAQSRVRRPERALATDQPVSPGIPPRTYRSIEPPPAAFGQESLDAESLGELGSQLGKMRRKGVTAYQVHVLGEVGTPGTIRVSPSTRLAEALQQSGFVSSSGSMRFIQLRRDGKVAGRYDLLRFYTDGKLNQNPYLQDNDVIFVPIAKKFIEVRGAIRRPDIYELTDERTLYDVVKLAGGMSIGAARNAHISVVRFNQKGEKKINEVDMASDSLRSFGIEAGDIIYIPSITTKDTKFDFNVVSLPGDRVFYPSYENRVFVIGGVNSPGAFDYSPHYTLDQYVTLCGGLSDRGVAKYRVRNSKGDEYKGHSAMRVNPGDTIIVKKNWLPPQGWISFGMSLASFGLSSTATVLALTRR